MFPRVPRREQNEAMKIQREVAVLDEACNSASCLSGEYNSENAGDSVVAVVDPPDILFLLSLGSCQAK